MASQAEETESDAAMSYVLGGSKGSSCESSLAIKPNRPFKELM
jgi:hypothetical protein